MINSCFPIAVGVLIYMECFKTHLSDQGRQSSDLHINSLKYQVVTHLCGSVASVQCLDRFVSIVNKPNKGSRISTKWLDMPVDAYQQLG